MPRFIKIGKIAYSPHSKHSTKKEADKVAGGWRKQFKTKAVVRKIGGIYWVYTKSGHQPAWF